MMLRLLTAWPIDTLAAYAPVMKTMVGSLTQHHTGHITEMMVDLVVPGGILIRRSCSFASRCLVMTFFLSTIVDRWNTRSARNCSSSHRYSICQLYTGGS